MIFLGQVRQREMKKGIPNYLSPRQVDYLFGLRTCENGELVMTYELRHCIIDRFRIKMNNNKSVGGLCRVADWVG